MDTIMFLKGSQRKRQHKIFFFKRMSIFINGLMPFSAFNTHWWFIIHAAFFISRLPSTHITWVIQKLSYKENCRRIKLFTQPYFHKHIANIYVCSNNLTFTKYEHKTAPSKLYRYPYTNISHLASFKQECVPNVKICFDWDRIFYKYTKEPI